MRNTILAMGTACALLGLMGGVCPADEAHTMSSAARTLSYTHLYADDKGVSHFRDEHLSFTQAASPTGTPGDTALASYTIAGAQGATLLALTRGSVEQWHTAPRRMFLIALQGMSEVTAGDGEVRRFGPGSVVLMDDTTGKGHITRAVGSVDHVALTVAVPASTGAPGAK